MPAENNLEGKIFFFLLTISEGSIHHDGEGVVEKLTSWQTGRRERECRKGLG
jgi:hypothetical protein